MPLLIAFTFASFAALSSSTQTRHPVIAAAPQRCAPATATRAQWEDIEAGARCRVSAFRRVPGSHPALYYQLQDYDGPVADDPHGVGIALMSATGDRSGMRVIAGWSGSNATIEPPRVVRTVQGQIIVIPMSASVSSVPQNDIVLRLIGGAWAIVATDRWHVAIPKGVEQWHGNAMDWPRLRAFGALWKPNDAECCPTGGSYVAQLRLDRRTLRVASVRYSKRLLPFR